MSNYTSCHWIQHGLSFERDHIEMCCLCCHKGGGHLYLKENYNGKGLKWEDIFKLKTKFIEDNKNGIIDPRCEGCFNLTHKDWDDDKKYINYIHFNHWTHCNSDCIYCYTSWDKKNFQKRPHYKVMPILKELFKKKLFHPDGEVTFAGGEPTILNEFDDIINLLIKNGANRITVHSSGIKFSKAIEKGIKEGKVSVCLSADAGSSETFYKVKRVNKFDKFWQNVEKYANAQTKDNDYLVETKFIIIPEINDNKEEVEKWFSLNLAYNIKTIVIDIENVYCTEVRERKEKEPKALIDLSKYILKRAKELNFNLVQYNNFRYIAEKYSLEQEE